MSGSEAELREALAAAKAMAVEPQLLAEAEARLCSVAAESELLSAMDLVKSLELDGEVDEDWLYDIWDMIVGMKRWNLSWTWLCPCVE